MTVAANPPQLEYSEMLLVGEGKTDRDAIVESQSELREELSARRLNKDTHRRQPHGLAPPAYQA